jgi:hypothetical protein
MKRGNLRTNQPNNIHSSMESTIFSDVGPCSLAEIYQHFRVDEQVNKATKRWVSSEQSAMCQIVVQIIGWGRSPEWTNRATRSINKRALKQVILQPYAPQKHPQTSIRLNSVTYQKTVQLQSTSNVTLVLLLCSSSKWFWLRGAVPTFVSTVHYQLSVLMKKKRHTNNWKT